MYVALAHAPVVGVDPLVHHDPDERVLAEEHPALPPAGAVLPLGDGVWVALALLLKPRRRPRHPKVGLVQRDGEGAGRAGLKGGSGKKVTN